MKVRSFGAFPENPNKPVHATYEDAGVWWSAFDANRIMVDKKQIIEELRRTAAGIGSVAPDWRRVESRLESSITTGRKVIGRLRPWGLGLNRRGLSWHCSKRLSTDRGMACSLPQPCSSIAHSAVPARHPSTPFDGRAVLTQPLLPTTHLLARVGAAPSHGGDAASVLSAKPGAQLSERSLLQ